MSVSILSLSATDIFQTTMFNFPRTEIRAFEQEYNWYKKNGNMEATPAPLFSICSNHNSRVMPYSLIFV
jgi:hypothetical protein